MVGKEWTGASYLVGERMDRRQAMIASEDQIQHGMPLVWVLGEDPGVA